MKKGENTYKYSKAGEWDRLSPSILAKKLVCKGRAVFTGKKEGHNLHGFYMIC